MDKVLGLLFVVGRENLQRRAAAALKEEGENEEREGEHERGGGNDAWLRGGSPRHEKKARGGLEGRRRRGGVHGIGALPKRRLGAWEEDDRTAGVGWA